MVSVTKISFDCSCGRKFPTKRGLSTHKRYCGNYKTWYHGGYEMMTGDDGNPIEVHKYNIEQKLGRKLKPGELVHHKDEDKLNNDPDNLEITTRSLHSKYHLKKYFDNLTENEWNIIKQKRSKTKKKQFIDSGYKNTSPLNKKQVLEIKERLDNEECGVFLSKEFNVSSTTIYNIKNGVSWKWIK